MKEKKKAKKRTALVYCRDGKQFWTTPKVFWQWVRDRIVGNVKEYPLSGVFLREHEEFMVLINHTILDIASPNHLREVMLSRRKAKKVS
jgi:hypothetical protein